MQNIDQSSLLFDNRYLRALIVPLLIETLLSVTIGMMDTIMVARVGEHAVSGVSLIDSIANLLIFLFSAFATGGAVIASQYLGRKDNRNACHSAKQLMVLNSCNALFRSMGKSRITMIVAIIMNLINVSGNALFIYVFGMETFGAGLASLLSRMVACFYMVYKTTRPAEQIHVPDPLKFELDIPMIRRILKIALPSGIENSVFHIGKILVSSTVASFGTASIAANAVFNALSTFANIPGSAIGMASVTVIGQCCGAREYDQASHYGKKLLGLTFLMMGATCLIIFLLTPELARLYNLSDAAYNLAVEATRLNMFQTLLFWPPAFTIPNFLRAAGDARFTMIVSIASMWIFRVMLSVILGVCFGLGFLGVCWGLFVDWYCRGILFTARFIKGNWKTKTVV